MTKLIKKLLLSASVAAGVSTVGAVPAIAADFTLTGGGTYNSNGWQNTDVILYEANENNTSVNQSANINDILDGDSNNPGGNIELYASSESDTGFWTNPAVTFLSGEINGQQLTLSSLNAYDWFWDGNSYNYSYGGNTLATEWFTQLWDEAREAASKEDSLANSVLLAMNYSDAYSLFFANKGFQAASDPNISYINSDGNDINIGLAGHYDLSKKLGFEFLPSGIQASEVVKYTYNGVTDYLYSFTATESGLYNQEEFDKYEIKSSHTGNYEVTIAVPEPSTMIGLMTVGGLLVAAKKKGQSKKDA